MPVRTNRHFFTEGKVFLNEGLKKEKSHRPKFSTGGQGAGIKTIHSLHPRHGKATEWKPG